MVSSLKQGLRRLGADESRTAYYRYIHIDETSYGPVQITLTAVGDANPIRVRVL